MATSFQISRARSRTLSYISPICRLAPNTRRTICFFGRLKLDSRVLEVRGRIPDSPEELAIVDLALFMRSSRHSATCQITPLRGVNSRQRSKSSARGVQARTDKFSCQISSAMTCLTEQSCWLGPPCLSRHPTGGAGDRPECRPLSCAITSSATESTNSRSGSPNLITRITV